MELADLNQWLAERNLGGHWTRVPTQGEFKPYLWKWKDIHEGLMMANDLVPMEKTGRRTITLKNPGLKVRMTNTIHISVQCVLPGEIATAHRHLAAAMRFVLKGSPKAHTVVEGEKFPMLEGDFITTPNWTWHDHYNSSDEPVYWLDGLDVRLIAIGEHLREEYSKEQQPIERPLNYSFRTLGQARPSWIKSEHPTPPFRYSWEETFATLQALKASSGDPFNGIHLRYVHPVNGGPTCPTFSCEVQLLRPEEKTQTHRHNCTTIYHAFRGQGVTMAGKEILEWDQGDIFVVPPWQWHNHENRLGQDAILFSMSDWPAMSALGLYREQKWEGGVQLSNLAPNF